MKRTPPVYLSLTEYRFPIAAIGSVLHRVSGVLLFVLLPWIMYLFSKSLHSSAGFSSVENALHNIFGRFFMWAFLSALSYHICAGLRHIIMDLGFGETLAAAKASTIVVLILSALLALLAGVWVW